MKNEHYTTFRFGMDKSDNDFVSTIEAFVRFIATLDYRPTKVEITTLWNEMSYGFYLSNQIYGRNRTPGDRTHIHSWLTEKMRIMVNEELDAYNKEGDSKNWWNGEMVAYDSRLPEGQRIYYR